MSKHERALKRHLVPARVAVAALAAFAVWVVLQADAAAAKDKLRIGVTSSASDVPFFIAEERGFFAEEGIIPEITPFPSATQMIAPLSSGGLDVGAGAPGAGLYNATKRNIQLKIVADKGSMGKGHGYLSLLVRKDLIDSGRVKTIADLKGMKIGDLSKHGSGDVTLNRILEKGGLAFGDVEPLYMSAPQLAVAMENKALDATLITEPNLSLLVQRNVAVLFAHSDEYYPNQQLAVVLLSDELIRKNRDLAQRFTNAYVKGARVYNDALVDGRLTGPGADKIIQILVDRTRLKDAAMYKTMITPGINPDCHVNQDGLRNDFAFYRKMGWIEHDQNPDDIVENSFCDTAIKKFGRYRRAG